LRDDPLDRAIDPLEPALERFFARSAGGHAADLLQEVRLRLEKTRAAYDPSRPAEPWIWRIAWLVLLEHRRARRYVPLGQLEEPVAAASLEPARREARELVWTCVRDLEEGRSQQRTFVVLHALESLPHARLAAHFGARESASKMRVLRGLEALELRLTRDRFLWPAAKTAAAAEAWDLIEALDPRVQHAATLLLFGRIDAGLQRAFDLGVAAESGAPLDELALERAQGRLLAAGFPP
jgi:DNA-directed RNA polymerase specialized sigma24 family protein